MFVLVLVLLLPIKEVPVKNDYFLHARNRMGISKCMGFCIGAAFTEKNMAHTLVMSLLFG